jgi:hypothetical protein
VTEVIAVVKTLGDSYLVVILKVDFVFQLPIGLKGMVVAMNLVLMRWVVAVDPVVG